MKLSTEDTHSLMNILSTCAAVGIDSVIIEDGLVRGVNDDKSCAIISDYMVPGFTQRIGLSRLSSLKSRIELLSGTAGTVIEANETERDEINALEIKSGKSKVQFRCTSTMLIKAPKQINDSAVFSVSVASSELKMLIDGIRVMGAKRVVLAIRQNASVHFELADATNDSFRMEIDAPAEGIDPDMDSMDSVVHYYPAGVFVSLLKDGARGSGTDGSTAPTILTVGAVGTIKATLNGHSLTMLPVVNDEGDD